jgi:CRP-like cAMP-binding protein
MKLSGLALISLKEESALEELFAHRSRAVAAHRSLIEEGDTPTVFYLIQDGWACGARYFEDGRRQITAFFLPGDICHLDFLLTNRMSYSIASLTSLTLAEVTPKAFEELTVLYPNLGRAFWCETVLSGAVQREWMINIAQRGAFERVSHLICELFLRLRRVGLTDGDSCEWPLTQTDLADALGLTGIHVNRMIQQLRSDELIVLKDRLLTIPDLQALKRVAGFESTYLLGELDRAV